MVHEGTWRHCMAVEYVCVCGVGGGEGLKLELENGKGQSLSEQTLSTGGVVCTASFSGGWVANPMVEAHIPVQAQQIWRSYLKASPFKPLITNWDYLEMLQNMWEDSNGRIELKDIPAAGIGRKTGSLPHLPYTADPVYPHWSYTSLQN